MFFHCYIVAAAKSDDEVPSQCEKIKSFKHFSIFRIVVSCTNNFATLSKLLSAYNFSFFSSPSPFSFHCVEKIHAELFSLEQCSLSLADESLQNFHMWAVCTHSSVAVAMFHLLRSQQNRTHVYGFRNYYQSITSNICTCWGWLQHISSRVRDMSKWKIKRLTFILAQAAYSLRLHTFVIKL